MSNEVKQNTMRIVDGRETPATGVWDIDPEHASMTFEAKHMMIAKARGSLSDANGTITVENDPADSSVELSIPVASLQSGSKERDAHLLSEDFLDVANHPTMSFSGDKVEIVGDRYRLHGELTVKSVTRPVILDFEFNGAIIDPWGNARAAFSASTAIDRTDWGLTWNMPLETGGVLVGKTVKITIEAEAVKRS
ncbi:MAG: YceI family protein [Actinomycetia bacterium]|nr:YceI family protein [Actinomycetes bacterium]